MAAIAVLFAVSGASGLLFEVLWVRALTLVIGHTMVAVSLVVSAFLLGLVLGSLWFGRWADRSSRPLLGYAALEALTAGFALGLTWLLPRLAGVLVQLDVPGGGPLWLRSLIVFLLILPPTFAMGGTLPFLTSALSRHTGTVGRSFAWLYTLNTLGAALGCAAAGFVLIGEFGLFRTALLAASVNLSVALAAALLHRTGALEAARHAPTQTPSPAAAGERSFARRVLMLAFALGGFASISYEVLWFRVLASFFKATSYAFSLMLVVFLLGLAVGGAIYAWQLARHPRPLAVLVVCQTAVALSALLSMFLLGQQTLLAGVQDFAAGGHGGLLLSAGLIMLVPTTMIGICFPLTIALIAQKLSRAGRDVGFLYSLNTLGGIAGSLVTGLLLVPWLGTQASFTCMALLSFAVALILQHCDPTTDKRTRLALWTTGAALAVGLLALPRTYLLDAISRHPTGRMLEVRDGRDGTAVVLEHSRQSLCATGSYKCGPSCTRDFSYRQLKFGSVSYASTILSDRRYMRALAHLPMLLHDAPRTALEICFGTGTTAAAFASYPSLELLQIVDLNPDVLALAPHFEDSNLGVLEDKRTRVAVEDGRHFLVAHSETFDVVSLEPPPPVNAGVVNLYSREFYANVRQRLRPGGILAQWLPLEQQNEELNRALVAAVLLEFPHVSLWMASRLEAVLIASSEPLRVDLSQWRARQGGGSIANMAEVGFTPETLLGTYLISTDGLKKFVAGAYPVTDDLPGIEYFLSHPGPALDVEALLALAEKPSALVPGEPQSVRAQLDRAAEATLLLTRAHVLNGKGRGDEARQNVQRAQALIGDDAYLSHMFGAEYGCLAPVE